MDEKFSIEPYRHDLEVIRDDKILLKTNSFFKEEWLRKYEWECLQKNIMQNIRSPDIAWFHNQIYFFAT